MFGPIRTHIYHKRNILVQNATRMMADSMRGISREKVVLQDGDTIQLYRRGTGPNVLLFLPGAMGCGELDFRRQLSDHAHFPNDRFTLIAWDPPGYGRSRPPARTFPIDFLNRDADCAHEMMKNLGYNQFNIFGWSDGGMTGLICASCHPESVKTLTVMGAGAYVTKAEVAIYDKIRYVNQWAPSVKEPLLELYGHDYFQQMWSQWIDVYKRIFNDNDGNICREVLDAIKCAVLVVHGRKDAMVPLFHSNYLHMNIKHSRLKLYEEGKHQLHIKYSDEFNRDLSDFVQKRLINNPRL